MSVSRGGGRRATKASQSVELRLSERQDSHPPRPESPAQPGFSLRPDMDFREILLIASKGQGVNHVPVSLRSCCRKPGRQVSVRWVELLRERLSAPGKPELRTPSSGVCAEIWVHRGWGWERESFLGVGFACSCTLKGRLCGLRCLLRVAQSRG